MSAHFTVDGASRTIYQHVSLDDRAWHALAANDFAVGIETVDGGPWGQHHPAVYPMTAWLIREVVAPFFGLSINEQVIGPHNRWVATACPANLDWQRIVTEAGGTQVVYITQEQFDAWRVALQKQLETSLVQRWEGDRITNGLRAAAGAPLTAKKAKQGLVIPKLPKAAKPTAKQLADARKGHGRGKMKGDKK